MLCALAQTEGHALECQTSDTTARCSDEQLSKCRHDLQCSGADPRTRWIDGQITPGENSETLLEGNLLDRGNSLRVCVRLIGQEGDTRRIGTGSGQVNPSLGHDGTQEGVRNLRKDASPITRIGLRPGRTSMFEVLQCGDAK